MNWQTRKVGNSLATVRRAGKLKKTEYQEVGTFPVIDQGEGQIAGYSDNEEIVHKAPLPIVVFGDHTRRLKLVRDPFICGADGTQLIYPKSSDLDLVFFFYALKNINLSNYFYARHFKFLKDQEFNSPRLTVQKRIASVLSAYDDLIENNRRRIVLLEEAARLLYREWFVHFRFPGHEHVKIIDGVPEGWKLTTLGGVAVSNLESHKKDKLPEVLNYIDISSVSRGKIDFKTKMSALAAPSRARRIARHGDTIWSNVRPNLRAYSIVQNPAKNDVFSTGFTVLHAEKIGPYYLYFFVTSNGFVDHLINHATGTSYPAVRSGDFKKAEIVVPPAELRDSFEEFCEPLFCQMEVLKSELQECTKAKDILLPRLMDGRLEV